MPKVIGATPPYLSRPSPGSQIFGESPSQPPVSPSKVIPTSSRPYQGPRRLISSRGAEVFTVVDNKIRWADLGTVREEWEENTQSGTSHFSLSRSGIAEPADCSVYRILAVPIYYQIRHISLSPSGLFLAVSTEHTVHIVVLPDSSRLKEKDRSPLKVKTYQLGPTVHVIPESSLASVLWHPLAYATTSTDCLVTVTTEAAVRLWEFDKSNSWSVDRPTLAIDLRKLADGVSCDQDFEPSGFGKTRGFSVDDFDMEVSSACFGGRGGEDEDAWASMTLWVAMRNGDIYALCPLLPSKWKPTSTTIPSLTTTAIARMASINDENTDIVERRAADQQYEWVQEIDNEEPQMHQSTSSLGEFEIRLRPQNPSAIPRLQGPFSTFLPTDDDPEFEISDVYVFPAKLDEDDLFGGEDDYLAQVPIGNPVPFTTICIATTESQVLVAVDLDGVAGQWLPKKGKSAFSIPSSEVKLLTLIDTVHLEEGREISDTNWPVFTPDIVHPHSLFANTTHDLCSISVNDWVNQLGVELTGTQPVDPGLHTRLETRCQNQIVIVDKLIESHERLDNISAPAIIDDESVGYLLLAPSINHVYGVVFNRGHLEASTMGPSTTDPTTTSSPSRLNSQLSKLPDTAVDTVMARDLYTPARIFYENHQVPIDSLRRKLPLHLKHAIAEQPMKLSPAMLEVMTHAHRVVGLQSSHLESAAAELFRRCLRLQEELDDQTRQMADLAEKLQKMADRENEDERGNVYRKKSPEDRMSDAQERQKKLTTRFEALRRKVGKAGTAKRDLSSKEVAWIEEMKTLGKNVGVIVDGTEELPPTDEGTSLDQRFETVKNLTHDLVEESQYLSRQHQQPSSPNPQPPALEASISSISNSSITPSMSASQITTTLTPRSSVVGTSIPQRFSTSTGGFGVSSRLQKERIRDVMGMVEREGAVIEAAVRRLERLRGEY